MSFTVDPGIFKAYDVRAIYPAQINGEVARRVGRAFIDYLGGAPKRIAVGRDVRLSSPEIAGSFIEGARSEGAEITDIGVVGTDMMYFHVASQDLDGGAIITASHNPKEYNGIKMVRRGALALSGDAGIKEIKEAIMAGRFADKGTREGKVVSRTISDEYADHCLRFIDVARVPRIKAVLDTGNGMGAIGASAIFKRLPVDLVKMYFDLDGTFPNHPPDPLEEPNRREIMERVAAVGAQIGMAWDGDADRCFFIDDTGDFVPGDFVTALLGESFVRKVPGSKIVYDVRASRAVRDRVQAAGGTALMNRVGHAFIKKRMRDENALFGGEVSGHFYFRDNWYADNGMIPALLVLELLGREGRKLSELLAPLRARYFITGEINSKVADVAGALRRIEERYGDAEITKMDGVSVDYPDWHFNVRPSNTEPLLRLNLEAYSQADMVRRRDEVL
ncbi:MAG TPA: phosphomannomutase/phosphoglucomutase, partial [Vicinamibacteria bacterium]|nr:phosphomannomutase/phosphoglucomutase [Vicinamibacteria bacterium]